LVKQKRLSDAEELLKPLVSQSRLHISEFIALADAAIALLVAQGQFEGARAWLAMWERVEPDDPQIPRYRAMLRSNPLAKLGRMIFRGNR
jgi:hypothetical protein